MRLIDADALRNKLGEVWDIPKDWDGDMDQACEDAFTLIDDADTIEAVPVVRCKDCKFFHTYADGSEVGLCYVWATDCEEPECNKYDFCSHGERKAV